MNSNEIQDEIRRIRDALMAECGGDLQRFGELRRAGEARWAAAGHPIVSFAGQPPLELPLPDWEKIDAEPENEIIAEIRATRRKMMEECGGDLGVLFAKMRAGTERLKAEGWEVVSFPPKRIEEKTCVVREDPPKP